jgi:hypothetical protein
MTMDHPWPELVVAPESCWTGLMIRRSRRLDSASPAVAAFPGADGLPAVPAGKPARRRTARLARTLRTRWWPKFLLTGVLVVVIGATLVSGGAAPWVIFAGAAISFISLFWSLSMSPADYRREPPMPPGAPGAGS